MIGSVVSCSGRKRSYNRNLAWCRFWLGIGIAIATLSFTFVAERGFGPIIGSPLMGEGSSVGALDSAVTSVSLGISPSDPGERIEWFDVFAFAALVLTSGSCMLIAYRFKLLYGKDEEALEESMSRMEE